MIGPIQSNPPSPELGIDSNYYGYYWFGTLPSNIQVILNEHHALYLEVCAFFNWSPSILAPYRTFILNSPETSVVSLGTDLKHCQILSYSPKIASANDYSLIRSLPHIVLSNFISSIQTLPSAAPTPY